MAHFAEVDPATNEVIRVIVADQDFINTGLVGDPKNWYKTSYNTKGGVHYNPDTNLPSDTPEKAFRKNYAGRGYTYDKERDAFIPPKPYPSWVLDEQSCLWVAPVPYPQDGKRYFWVEETQSWRDDQFMYNVE